MSDHGDILSGGHPQSLLLAMEQLISGERSIPEFRDEMLNTIYDTPSSASSVRSLVDDYARRGLIPAQIHRLLIRDIDKICNEEVATTPTEFTMTGEVAVGVVEDTESHAANAEPQRAPTGEKQSRGGALEVGSLLRDRFEIVRRASGGSMGVVYKAIDRRLAEAEGGETYVAIKVLAPAYAGHAGAIRALQQEATKVRYLNHPNIIRFLDLDRSDGEVFLVMEWLEGRALSTVLNERPGEPVAEEEALLILRALCAALQHAHELGVTHADVKPGNIMLLENGDVKLLDFGIARARGDLAAKTSSADPRIINAATPAYASPAVLSGQAARPVDDVFSLACVAYRLFSGQRVFRDKSALEASREGLRPERIGTLTGSQWRALSRALSLDEDERTTGVREFAEAFGLHGEAQSANWGLFATIAACVALIGILLVFAIRSGVNTAADSGDATAATTALEPAVASALPQGDESALSTRTVEKLPEVSADKSMVTSVSDPDATARRAPTIDFTVTDADWVTDDAGVLTIKLPSPDSIVPAVTAEMRLVEGGGGLRIEVRRDELTEARDLILIRQRRDEALDAVIAQRLVLPDGQVLRLDAGQASTNLRIDFINDDQFTPTFDGEFFLADRVDQEVVARLRLSVSDDENESGAAAFAPDTVSFAEPELTVREGEAAARLLVWRFSPTNDALQVPIRVLAGAARSGDDFMLAEAPAVRFSAGSPAAWLFVPIVADEVNEESESVTFALPEAAELAEGLHPSLTLRILDDRSE